MSALDALQLMAEYQIKENVARGREPSDCTDVSYQKYVDGLKSAKALLKLKTFFSYACIIHTVFFFNQFDTLPETNIAHENPIFPGKYHQNGGFSMAMLVSGSV